MMRNRMTRARDSATPALVALVVMFAGAALAIGACSTGPTARQPAAAPGTQKEAQDVFALTSPAFESGGHIPAEYASTGVRGGQNVSMPFEWRGAPDGTRSFALVLVDRHPVARSWVHWMVTSIPADATGLARGASGTAMPAGSVEHRNTFGAPGYGGPQPPIGSGEHEYEAVLYALDVASVSGDPRTLAELTTALDGHMLASASCSGMFGR